MYVTLLESVISDICSWLAPENYESFESSMAGTLWVVTNEVNIAWIWLRTSSFFRIGCRLCLSISFLICYASYLLIIDSLFFRISWCSETKHYTLPSNWWLRIINLLNTFTRKFLQIWRMSEYFLIIFLSTVKSVLPAVFRFK